VPRLNWSRPLPRTLIIPDVMTLTTLADVRELVEHHVPAEVREKSTWQYLAQQLSRGRCRPSSCLYRAAHGTGL
jgi:hypothetical protein